ncbi:MAG: hypothetical protein GC146_09320 [Limimaricola sp.]|uniref:protein-disulfide reductase DsbD domain-containing protein n=1 Tax=Limimaricola sp. TaxID=2211665 RepID=UPI001D3284CD|nr:protein-disulfide reductase DsbD domain-containing protein [Limimaricola sp.]MBI1417410.1 hypothetical protein [Limimaricola sp.]
MTMRRLAILLAGLAGFAAPVAVQAEGLPSQVAAVTVLPGWRMPDGHQMAALRLVLAPGWHTYWRSPGDAGIPPQVTWAGSRNVAGATFLWPVPEVFDSGGMRTIGYTNQVVIPVKVTLPQAGPARLQGTLDIGVCQDVCMPVSLDFAADLPDQPKRDAVILGAMLDQPLSADDAKVRGVTCRTTPAGDRLRLTAQISMPSAGAPENVVIEAGDPRVWVSEPVTHRDGGVLTATAEMAPPAGEPLMLDRSSLRITVLGRDEAVDITGCTGG